MGVNAKYLMGMAYANIHVDKLNVQMNGEKWMVETHASAEAALFTEVTVEQGPMDELNEPKIPLVDAIDGFDGKNYKPILAAFKPASSGFAVDLGVVYDMDALVEGLTVSASLTDLGSLRWKYLTKLMVLPLDTLAIHSSCIVFQDKAVLFLGESGTGKSTHTRLWREHIPGAVLLNDDSPMVRVEDGKVWVYGSAWSGKTPCYKNERYELKACVRLSQAPHNQMRKLSVLQAYGAIHPSCAPEFAYDEALYDKVSQVIGQILSVVPFYHLACLPDREAALLSCKTIYGVDNETDTE